MRLNVDYNKITREGFLRNKAYRPNAHLLDTLMHYNIILHYCYNYYSCIIIICNFDHISNSIKMTACGVTMSTDFALYLCIISWNYVNRL